MSFLTFLFSFLGMVILIPAICYGFFKLSILLKSNILSRGNTYYTLIRFEHLDSIPPLLDNPNFLKTGKWEYFPEANYFKGFSKLSDRELQNWTRNNESCFCRNQILNIKNIKRRPG